MLKDPNTPKYFKESLEMLARDTSPTRMEDFIKRNMAYEVEKQIANCRHQTLPIRPPFIDKEHKTTKETELIKEYLNLKHSIEVDNETHRRHLERLLYFYDDTDYKNNIEEMLKTHKL